MLWGIVFSSFLSKNKARSERDCEFAQRPTAGEALYDSSAETFERAVFIDPSRSASAGARKEAADYEAVGDAAPCSSISVCDGTGNIACTLTRFAAIESLR